MDLYLVGAENTRKKEAMEISQNNALLSYHYLIANYSLKFSGKLFIDSGGFSAFTKGVEIDIDKYIQFIKQNESFITVYSQLDTIGNYLKTNYQLKYMEDKGLKPLPVFHFGSDYKELEKLCQKYSYIALGGLVPYAKNKPILKKHLSRCFSIGGKGQKFHGFGMTGIEILKTFPFYSVDSASWLGGSMRAEIYQFIQESGKMKIIDTKSKNKATYKSISFTDNDNKKWYERIVNNALEWKKFEKYITELWKARGIVWND